MEKLSIQEITAGTLKANRHEWTSTDINAAINFQFDLIFLCVKYLLEIDTI